MPQPLTWLGLGASGVLGVALGVQMGYSAVGEINPVYFDAPEARLTYADLSGYRAPSWAPQQTSPSPLYAEPSPAPEYPEDGSRWRQVSGPDPQVDTGSASAPEPAVYRPAQLVLADLSPPEPRASTELVERYAAMPIEAVETEPVEVETAAIGY